MREKRKIKKGEEWERDMKIEERVRTMKTWGYIMIGQGKEYNIFTLD